MWKKWVGNLQFLSKEPDAVHVHLFVKHEPVAYYLGFTTVGQIWAVLVTSR